MHNRQVAAAVGVIGEQRETMTTEQRKPLTPELLRSLLLEELSPKFPGIEIGTVAVSTSDGSAQWLVEVKAPVRFFRVFRPDPIGQIARARIFACEVEQGIADRLGADADA